MTPRSLRFSPTLWNVGLRYLLRHRWQTILMMVGIALGVAVMVAIDLANASASRAFELSTEVVTGRANYQISGGTTGLDQSVYVELRRQGWLREAAPVISEYVVSPELGGQPMQLLGVDPFAEPPFRSYLGGTESPSLDDLVAFFTQPGAVLISEDLADRNGLELGSPLTLDIRGEDRRAFVAGLLRPSDSLSRRTLEGLVLTDISTAQELTGRLGKIDRIDLILPSDPSALLPKIEALLPPGAAVSPVEARQGTLEQMTEAFQINLTALSLLALVVGLFLIYNTMTFSVVQRRSLFGTLRCLGVTRREVFILVLGEALVVGLIGSILGIGLGILLSQAAVRMILQTINDLYFTTTVRDVGISTASLVKGGLIGLLAAILTTLPPAWEAASIPPRMALIRSTLEVGARVRVRTAAVAAVIIGFLGLLLFAIPTRSLITGFTGTLGVVLGFALLTSAALVLLMKIFAPPLGRWLGPVGRMAPRSLINTLSRTSIAVAALMVAVAVTIGVSLMINNFRETVIVWLEETLQNDVYISAPSLNAAGPGVPVEPERISLVSSWPGVNHVDLLRLTEVDSPLGLISVIATDNTDTGYKRQFAQRQVSAEETWAAMQAGAIVISEPLANRLSLSVGQKLTLNTPAGPRDFPIVGIYYDYSSSQGIALMDLDLYRELWNDPAITAVGLNLEPGVSAEEVTRQLQDATREGQSLVIRPNRELREDVLVVFDRTFAITSALQILATVVAFIGVLNALLLLQLERAREIGILRAVGLTVRQLWGMVMLETGLMGITAGLLAIPTGYALSIILVYIINRRSFGWTLQMALVPEPFLQGLIVALLAALLAGIYPARKLGRMAAAEAIRYE